MKQMARGPLQMKQMARGPLQTCRGPFCCFIGLNFYDLSGKNDLNYCPVQGKHVIMEGN